MKIIIETTQEEFKEVKAQMEASIINRSEWEKSGGKTKLIYKLGSLLCDDLLIKVTKELKQ